VDPLVNHADPFTPPTRERLIDKIVSQIKDLIYSNEIQVGDKLPSERELARKLRVSRAVVGDALRALERAGLVEIRPGATGGAFVTHDIHLPLFWTLHDLLRGGKLSVVHFCEARSAIECESVREAIEKVTEKDIQHLRSLNEKLLEHLTAGDTSKLRTDNLSFHVDLARIGGNPIITLMVHSLLRLAVAAYPYASDSRKFVKAQHERHEAIMQALEAKDAAHCQELMALDAASMKDLKRTRTSPAKRRAKLSTKTPA
jgi:GntR family transcriptional regulator, transcriptional repressor for pyruvate dehydrogenase complex